MSEAVQIAAFLLVAGAIGWLAKLQLDHLRDCRKFQAEQAHARNEQAQAITMMLGTLERLVEDVGTHETGLRGQVHSLQSAVLRIDGRVNAIERREDDR